VNSYFQILVQYGDQYRVLDFRDLIEVKQNGETGIDVELRNPEYELTRSIKRVMYGFQGGGDLFAALKRPLTLNGYISADARLPDFLKTFKQDVQALAGELKQKSGGKLEVRLREPEANGGALAKKIETDYGFRPMQAGLLDSNRFFFYLTLDDGEQTVEVPLPEDFSRESLEQSLNAALKRFSAGYLKTVALAVPKGMDSAMARFGMGQPGKEFRALSDQLQANHNVRQVDLSTGAVPEAADILVVADPEGLDDKGLFAIDQFLMKGGTVLVATSPFKVSLSRDSLSAAREPNRVLDWLGHNGIGMEERMVLDERNQPFPVPVTRNIGGFTLQELRMVPYPYFIDLRGSGLNPKLPVTSGLGHVMFNWASPISIDEEQNKERKTTWLLKSSPDSWTSDSVDLIPRLEGRGGQGFAAGNDQGEKLLAVAVEGRFTSYFQGKESPLLQPPSEKKGAKGEAKETSRVSGVIDRSPESARIILFGSSDFLTDQTLQIAAGSSGRQELGGLQLVENAVDWSLEDPGLLSIRSRGHYARTLMPLERDSQMICEYLNYAQVLGGLLLVFIFSRLRARRTRRRYQLLLEGRL